MIDLKKLRENTSIIREAAKAKNVEIDFTRVLELDKLVRALQQDIQQIATQKNEASKRIPQADEAEKEAILTEMKQVDRKGDELKAELQPLEQELDDLLHKIPNPALSDVKVASNESENEVLRTVGEIPEFSFTPKDHMEIGQALGIIDTERAAKVSGARFSYLKGDGVMLEFALIQYALDTVMKYGFTPVTTPHMVNARSMRAMGYLEHGGHDEIYYLPKDNMYLIGTSEQSVGPMHMDEILDLGKGAMRYAGFSPCYRREAGTYGKDTKGILRVHQFDKIEMFSFCKPEDSDAEHNMILEIEEKLMNGLGVPYQVLKMVTGDLGLPAARKYDIEAWLPSQEKYRETHSCSTCTDFQARRLNTRFKDEEGKPQFVHTLNGTAFAIGRTMISILENFQQEDGSVIIPEALRGYMGGKERLTTLK
ncbi:serine--tRNA ligase [Candidatus Uhrbacteria bacterium]|jgi:seryl-tRNA synthetase|nr:serine--tRNA ligase [Candidatus Uhrbacteria bacterium]MBT7717435.1 serine--tRNA ligase [Candidatus Uhrbacteria bacterium]